MVCNYGTNFSIIDFIAFFIITTLETFYEMKGENEYVYYRI